MEKNKRNAIICACLTAIVAMDGPLTNSIFSYILDSYPDVSENIQYLFLRAGHFVGIFSALLVGPLTMRVSRKVLMVFSLTSMISVGMIYAFFGGVCPYWLMIACAGIDGLESSILSCIPSAIITENIHNRTKKNRFNGYVSACTMAGALMFSVVGGAIGATGWQKAYYVYFTAVPILLIVLLIMPRESVKKIRMRRPEEITQRYRKKDFKRSSVLYRTDSLSQCERKTASKTGLFKSIPVIVILMYLHYILFYACTYTFKATLSVYIIAQHKLGTSAEAGLVSSIITIGGIISGIVFGFCSKRLRKWTAVILSLCLTLGYLSTAFWTAHLTGCALGAFLIGFAKGGMTPFVIDKLSVKLKKEYISFGISILISCMNLGMAMSPTILRPLCCCICSGYEGNGIFSVNTWLIATTILAAVTTVCSVLLYVCFDNRSNEKEHQHPHQRCC